MLVRRDCVIGGQMCMVLVSAYLALLACAMIIETTPEDAPLLNRRRGEVADGSAEVAALADAVV